MQNSHTHTLLLILVGVGLATCVLSLSAYMWVFVKVEDTVNRVSVISEEAQLLATKNAHTQTVRRIVRDTLHEREALNEYFLTEEELVTFLGSLETLSTYSGATVAIQSVSVGEAIDKDGLITSLKLSLKSIGSLQAVYHNLALLETFPKTVSVNSIRLTQDPSTLVWEGVFDITVIKIELPEEA